jgi:hypothetical protein
MGQPANASWGAVFKCKLEFAFTIVGQGVGFGLLLPDVVDRWLETRGNYPFLLLASLGKVCAPPVNRRLRHPNRLSDFFLSGAGQPHLTRQLVTRPAYRICPGRFQIIRDGAASELTNPAT